MIAAPQSRNPARFSPCRLTPTLLLFAFSFSVLQPSGLFAETLTIATYNVENYTLAGRMVEGAYQPGYPKTEAAKAALRAVIKTLDADILALQEMGAREYLAELQRDLRGDGVDYPHGEVLEGADADRHVALLSRRPFATVRKHTDLDFQYFGQKETVKRGMIEAHVATDAGDLVLFIVHLKSRLTDRADDPESLNRRCAEAAAIRDRVLRVFPDPSAPHARFMILGDCNDSLASRPMALLCKRGKTTLAAPLPAADSRGEVWTHFFRKQEIYSRVDHMFVSHALRDAVENGAAKICDTPPVREASDHRPVSVRLDLRKN